MSSYPLLKDNTSGGGGGNFVPSSWTGSNASLFAGTSSYVSGSVFTGINPALTASYALTASTVLNPYPINVTGSTLYSVAPVAGVPNIPGANNSIFFGDGAGYNAPLAANSNFLGYQAGYNVTSVNNANFIGYYAGRNATTAINSNFIGNRAGLNATTAINSNFIGTTAGEEAPNTQQSNFIGYYAGYQATDASQSNFIGSTTGRSASNAAYSNFLGYSAGEYAANASHSILIGSKAGYNNLATANNSVGPNNIILGTNITLPPASKNSINIGGLIFATGSHSDFFAINPLSTPADGKVGINVYPPLYNFHVSGTVGFPDLTDSNTATKIVLLDNNGQLFTTASSAVGGGGSGVTINNNTNNYLVTATGTSNTLDGEANLTFDGSYLTITGGLIVNDGTTNLLDTTVSNLYSADSSQSIDWSNRSLYTADGLGGVVEQINWSNSAYIMFPNLSTNSASNVLVVDGSGRLYRTASSDLSVKTAQTASYADTASAINVTVSSNTDEFLPVIIAYTGSSNGAKLAYIDNGFQFNPFTNALYLPSNGALVAGNVTISSNTSTFGSATAQNHTLNLTGSLNVTKSLNVVGSMSLNVIPTASFHISGTTIINGGNLVGLPFSSFTTVPTQITGNTGIRGFLYIYPRTGVTSSILFGGGGYQSWTLRSLGFNDFQIRSTSNENAITGPQVTLMHFSSGSNGEFRIGVLNETPEYTFDISGSARVTSSFYLPGLTSSSQLNFLTVDTASGQVYYAAINSTSSVIGNGISSSFNINHGFNTRNLHITVYESSSNGETVYPDIRRINENTASIIFANPPTTNQYVVYISQ